jgi:hypothetical protein
MAKFSKVISSGYLMNTNNFTITSKFSSAEIELAEQAYDAKLIETTDKVFSYENV